MSDERKNRQENALSQEERARARALFVRRLVLAEILARPGEGPLTRPRFPRPRPAPPPVLDDSAEKVPP